MSMLQSAKKMVGGDGEARRRDNHDHMTHIFRCLTFLGWLASSEEHRTRMVAELTDTPVVMMAREEKRANIVSKKDISGCQRNTIFPVSPSWRNPVSSHGERPNHGTRFNQSELS